MARLSRFSPQPRGKDSRTSGQCWGHSSPTCSCLPSHLNPSLAISPPSNLGPEAPTLLLQPSSPIPAGEVLAAREVGRGTYQGAPLHSRQAATAPRRALGGGAWLLLCARSCSWYTFPREVYPSSTPARGRGKLQRCLQFGFRKHYRILLGWGEGRGAGAGRREEGTLGLNAFAGYSQVQSW